MAIFSKGKYGILLIPTLIVVLFALFAYFSDSVLGQVSPDAIAIRVIPNPSHYSARRWYIEKKFIGSPQSLLVDGYEAVRDGRTVYVNAANIDAISGTDVLYTNIYIISFNQEAEQATVDIFGEILTHWSFNVNVTTVGQCDVTLSRSCLKDSECPLEEHCLSPKAKIIRDTRRLADLAEIKIGLEKYKTAHGGYVTLAAGSYLPQTSISVWPSWQKILSASLGLGSSLPIDPINKLGACPGNYNQITCWDETTKRFADADTGNSVLDLPAGSKAYVFIGAVNGASFTLCAVMESGLVSGAGSGSCAGTGNVNVSGSTANSPPVFTVSNLTGYKGQPYSGFVSAFDLNGDRLSWAMALNAADYTGNGWAAAPVLFNFADYTEMVRSSQAGNVGVYNLNLTIDDGRGGVTTQNFTINIEEAVGGRLATPNFIYIASTTNPLNYRYVVANSSMNFPLSYSLSGIVPANWQASFTPSGSVYNFGIAGTIDTGLSITAPLALSYGLTVTDSSGINYQGNFSITVINNPPTVNVQNVSIVVGQNNLVTNPLIITAIDPENNDFNYTLNGILPTGLTGQTAGRNYVISGVPNGSTPQTTEYDFISTVTDDYNATGTGQFKITVINHAPVITFSGCAGTANLNSNYSCQATASDPDGHAIASYSLVAGTYPAGLGINSSGLISGTANNVGTYQISVTATDIYGAVSQPAVTSLTVNTFCGDGRRETPNSQGTGGPLNNGFEDCDGTDNVAASPDLSSASKQYACSNACVFTGGYCGDSLVQSVYSEQCEAPGNGTSVNNQYDCTLCHWSGGWCGDGVCKPLVEDCGNCVSDCACGAPTICLFGQCISPITATPVVVSTNAPRACDGGIGNCIDCSWPGTYITMGYLGYSNICGRNIYASIINIPGPEFTVFAQFDLDCPTEFWQLDVSRDGLNWITVFSGTTCNGPNIDLDSYGLDMIKFFRATTLGNNCAGSPDIWGPGNLVSNVSNFADDPTCP